jgi:hypothetical protein
MKFTMKSTAHVRLSTCPFPSSFVSTLVAHDTFAVGTAGRWHGLCTNGGMLVIIER